MFEFVCFFSYCFIRHSIFSLKIRNYYTSLTTYFSIPVCGLKVSKIGFSRFSFIDVFFYSFNSICFCKDTHHTWKYYAFTPLFSLFRLTELAQHRYFTFIFFFFTVPSPMELSTCCVKWFLKYKKKKITRHTTDRCKTSFENGFFSKVSFARTCHVRRHCNNGPTIKIVGTKIRI